MLLATESRHVLDQVIEDDIRYSFIEMKDNRGRIVYRVEIALVEPEFPTANIFRDFYNARTAQAEYARTVANI